MKSGRSAPVRDGILTMERARSPSSHVICGQNTMTYSPPTRAPYEPGDVTTCVPSDAYVLGVTRRPSGACSAST